MTAERLQAKGYKDLSRVPARSHGSLLVPTKMALEARAAASILNAPKVVPPPFMLEMPYFVCILSRKAPDPKAFPLALSVQNGRVFLDFLDSAAAGSTWKFVPAPHPATRSPGPPTNTPHSSLTGYLPDGATASASSRGRKAGARGLEQRQSPNSNSDSGEELEPRIHRLLSSPSAASLSGECYYIACADADNFGFLTHDMTLSDNVREAERFVPVACNELLRRTVVGTEVALQLMTVGSPMLLCVDEVKRGVYLLHSNDVALKDPQTGTSVFNDVWELTLDEELPESLVALVTSKLADPATR